MPPGAAKKAKKKKKKKIRAAAKKKSPAAAAKAAARKGGGPGGTSCNTILGTPGKDRLHGTGGEDCIYGRRGADQPCRRARGRTLSGAMAVATSGSAAPGPTRLLGGIDRDLIRARDGERDVVDCGRGRHDRAIVDAADRVRGCEKAKRG